MVQEDKNMSRSNQHTNLKPYRYTLNHNDPQGTCCVCDGRKIYTRKSVCDGLVDSYFAEGQRPSWGMHPCYGYSMDPKETGLCLYSNKQNLRSDPDTSYTCLPITLGNLNSQGKTNYCDYETVFGVGRPEKKKEYEFRFIALPPWSKCATQSGNAVPVEFLGANYSRDSVSLRRILPFDTAESQGPIKKPVHRNPGKILNIIKNNTDNSKVLQVVESRDSLKRRTVNIKTRQDHQ